MKSRHQRLIGIGLVLIGVGLGATFLLRAMNENILFFYSPTQVAAGEPPADRRFRVGGLVVPGSGFAGPGHFRIAFCVDDQTIVNALPGFKKVMQQYT